MPTTSFPEKKSNSKMNKKGVAHQVTFSLMSFTCFIPMQKCTFWKNAIRATEWDPFTSNVQCTCKENLAIHSQRQMMLNTCVKSWTSNYMVRMVVLRVLNFIQKLWWFAWGFMVKFVGSVLSLSSISPKYTLQCTVHTFVHQLRS